MADDKPVVGYSMTGVPITESKRSAPKVLWFIVGSLAIVGVLFSLVLVGSHGQDNTTSSDNARVGDSRLGAFDVCQRFVSERLKSPASAKWRDPFGDQVIYAGDGDGPITVTSSVDSQNGFGALIRSSYTCTVAKVSGGTWQLQSLNIQ